MSIRLKPIAPKETPPSGSVGPAALPVGGVDTKLRETQQNVNVHCQCQHARRDPTAASAGSGLRRWTEPVPRPQIAKVAPLLLAEPTPIGGTPATFRPEPGYRQILHRPSTNPDPNADPSSSERRSDFEPNASEPPCLPCSNPAPTPPSAPAAPPPRPATKWPGPGPGPHRSAS